MEEKAGERNAMKKERNTEAKKDRKENDVGK